MTFSLVHARGVRADHTQWRHTLFLLLLLCELSLLFSLPASSLRKQSGLLAVLHTILPSTPPFMQIRLLHRIFASASIGISQLAGVWADPSTSDKQGMEQAIGLVQSLESDGRQTLSLTSILRADRCSHGVLPGRGGPDPAELCGPCRDRTGHPGRDGARWAIRGAPLGLMTLIFRQC